MKTARKSVDEAELARYEEFARKMKANLKKSDGGSTATAEESADTAGDSGSSSQSFSDEELYG